MVLIDRHEVWNFYWACETQNVTKHDIKPA